MTANSEYVLAAVGVTVERQGGGWANLNIYSVFFDRQAINSLPASTPSKRPKEQVTLEWRVPCVREGGDLYTGTDTVRVPTVLYYSTIALKTEQKTLAVVLLIFHNVCPGFRLYRTLR